ncbi:hypothetical protein Drorol1_Dr00012736 [Drosera rotundifolia]
MERYEIIKELGAGIFGVAKLAREIIRDGDVRHFVWIFRLIGWILLTLSGCGVRVWCVDRVFVVCVWSRISEIEEPTWVGIEETAGVSPATHHVGAHRNLIQGAYAAAHGEDLLKALDFEESFPKED